MIIFKLVCFTYIAIVVPILLGMLITYFKKNEKIEIIKSIILGYLLKFAIFELLTIPMIFFRVSFTIVWETYLVLLTILSIISIIINFKNIKQYMKESFKLEFLKNNKVLKCFSILLILVQVFISCVFMHEDADDAFYVGTATTTLQTNTLFEINALDGTKYIDNRFPIRYVLSPFPIYLATFSKIIDIHPAIVAHTIFPAIFILLTYGVYYLLGKKILKNEQECLLFIIIMSFINMWGNYSNRTTFSFLLFRIWQGKAILANIMIPFICYIFLYCIEEKNKIDWIIVFISILASCLVSSMGVVLSSVTLCVHAFVFTIKDKKISYIWKSILCILPCIILGIIYIVY